MALRPFNPMRLVLAAPPLVVLGLALAGCRNADSSPTAHAKPAQTQIKTESETETASTAEQDSTNETITWLFKETPIIAVIEDQAIRSHESKEVDPNDDGIAFFHEFEVTLVEALRGEVPSSFSFYSFDNDYDGPATRNDTPYIVGLCRMGDKFYADTMVGRLSRHILEFDALMRQRLATAEPADFGAEACSFDLLLPE